ncbi:MAG: cellulase family glycosylhydrolase [Kiritimatiellae bacterium]|nr:cellulase family glycosylhydrolase [Kiritimatiellia bacterium]
MRRQEILGAVLAAAFFAAPCVAAVQTAGIEWTLGRNATRTGDVIVVDTHGQRNGGAAHAKIDLGGQTGGVRATIRARGRGIGRPDKSYFGLKFMFHYRDPASGAEKWPQADHKGGDFDWTTLELTTDLGPTSVGEVGVTLGLQNVAGKVEFDVSSFKVEPFALYEFPRHNQDYKVKYPDGDFSHKEHKEHKASASPRLCVRKQLRGAMLPLDPTEDDIKTLAEWGGTIGRFQMSRNFQKIDANLDFPEYEKWLDGRLDLLEKVLVWARKYGMKICVDLHVPPGSIRDNSEMRMFTDKACLDLYIKCWEKIARRFKGNADVIYGYDLLNEPHQNRHEVPFSYWDAQRLAAEAIRRIDPATTIVMEANWSSSAPAYEYMSPLAMDNVIYEVHMYIPSDYTHQGVHGWSPAKKWPDESKEWNKEMLRAKLAPVVAFAQRHDARIFVGEFSAIAWAPGAERYLKDCIELFDEYGWDWCYHAFNEWRGWNVEYAGESREKLRRVGDTPRKRVLIEGLKGKKEK